MLSRIVLRMKEKKGKCPDSVFQVIRKSTRHIGGNEHCSGWVESEEGIQTKKISFVWPFP